MTIKNTDTNSGVQASNGFAFQRNSAICILLDKYDLLVGNNFFICIEHFDDVIFTFLDNNNEVNNIDSYQAKKSTSSWSTDKVLGEIVAKMTNVGANLLLDKWPKNINYKHDLIFLTNNTIKLNCANIKKKGVESYSEIVREDNFFVSFSDLHENIRNNLIEKMDKFEKNITQLENIKFMHLDVGATDKSQKEQILGKISKIFKGKFIDSNAALELILSLFRNVETVYNQGHITTLLDESKRIYSSKIFEALNVIENKTKTYEKWRLMANEVAKRLKIPLAVTRDYKRYIDNSFDYFKDLKMVEFQKIYHFVNSSDVDSVCYSEEESILTLNKEINEKLQLNLSKEVILFAIVAAYVETRGESL
ncbi:dsDNA nuclease domain-containing protein [Acinetobacter pittii]|uniref:dsDNA nuclease domain-containing protein n=1 Tax=Acinetobacter pittii TaxID=48296 RepID=UPI00396F5935